MKERTDEIIFKKLKTSGLVIGNIPKNTRDEFVRFAEEEFADNYASCLKHLWDNYKLWKVFFENIDLKLDKILYKLESKTNNEPVTKRMLSGREIKLKGGKNE